MLLHVELAGRAQAQARVRSSAQSVKAAAAAGGMEGLARSHRSDSAPLSRVHERERTYIPVNQGLGAPLSPAEAKRRAGEALAAQRRLAPDVEGSKDPEESKPRRAPPLSTSDVRSRRTFEELKECDLEELQRRTRKESKEFPQAAVVKVDAAQASKPQLISVLLEHKLTGGKAKAEEVQQGAVSALQVNIPPGQFVHSLFLVSPTSCVCWQGTTVKLRAQRQAKSTIVVRNTTATQSELAVKMDALLDDSGLNVQDLELQGRDQAEPAETQGKPANMPLPPSLPNGSTPGSTGPRAKQMGPPKSPRHGKHVKQLTPAERARKLEQEKKAAQQKDDTQLVGTAKASARLLSRRRALSHIEMRTNWIAKAIFAAAAREGKVRSYLFRTSVGLLQHEDCLFAVAYLVSMAGHCWLVSRSCRSIFLAAVSMTKRQCGWQRRWLGQTLAH
jgi:hypothetical protein